MDKTATKVDGMRTCVGGRRLSFRVLHRRVVIPCVCESTSSYPLSGFDTQHLLASSCELKRTGKTRPSCPDDQGVELLSDHLLGMLGGQERCRFPRVDKKHIYN